VLNAATNQSREAIAAEAGNFRFLSVQPGAYTISVSMTGFKAYRMRDITGTPHRIARVDIPLEV
jgi:hypothetical protein